MKAASFSYHAPQSVAEAVELMRSLDNPKVIAGGQSLMPMMNFRVVTPDHLIDLGRIDELRGIRRTDDGLCIGSMTTQRIVQKSDVVRTDCPLLVHALRHVGHQTTRNVGTIGGSLCHLDPAAELPVACSVLDPVLECIGPAGVRRIPFADFPVDYLTTSLAADEILVGLEFSHDPPGSCSAFEEFSRRPGDFAIVSIAVRFSVDTTGVMRDVRIAAGGVAPVPQRLVDAERLLLGVPWDKAAVEEAAEVAGTFPADGDGNNPVEYRQHLMKSLTLRALERAWANRNGAVHG